MDHEAERPRHHDHHDGGNDAFPGHVALPRKNHTSIVTGRSTNPLKAASSSAPSAASTAPGSHASVAVTCRRTRPSRPAPRSGRGGASRCSASWSAADGPRARPTRCRQPAAMKIAVAARCASSLASRRAAAIAVSERDAASGISAGASPAASAMSAGGVRHGAAQRHGPGLHDHVGERERFCVARTARATPRCATSAVRTMLRRCRLLVRGQGPLCCAPVRCRPPRCGRAGRSP